MARAFPLLGFLAFLCACAPIAQAVEPSPRLKALQEAANAHYIGRDYQQALDAGRQALALTVQEYGPDDKQTGAENFGVAVTAEKLGDLVLAEQHYRECIRIYEKVYGVDNPGSVLGMEMLAKLLIKAGRVSQAESLYEWVLKIHKASRSGDHWYTASVYAGLGDSHLARGDYAGALPLYRKAITLLTTRDREQDTMKSIADATIKFNRDIFIGLTRAASVARRQPGADVPALMDETYAAGQLAWATSAASALAKMTTRLKAGDTDLGRAMRELQALSDRILALHDEDVKARAAWTEVQKKDPAYSQSLDTFFKADTKRDAPLIKRRVELMRMLRDVWSRCPLSETKPKPGCEDAKREQETISTELTPLSEKIEEGTAEIADLLMRVAAAEERLPGYAEHTASRKARSNESQRLENERAARSKEIVNRFPAYISLSEPRPLTVADTRALLGEEEALVVILSGGTRTIVWAVTRERADWVEVEASEDQLAAHIAALRRGLDPMLQPLTELADTPPTVVRGFDLVRAHTLYKLLLEPVAPILAGKQHLLLVPTGPLTSLPFQVLLTNPPTGLGPTALREASWLIRRHALSVLPSVQSLSSLRKLAAAGTAVKPFFGIGDPVLVGPGAAEQKRGSAPVLAAVYRDGLADVRALRELMPLPETADELRAVARTLRAPRDAIRLREAATEAGVKDTSLDEYRVLHFATHGLVAGDLDGVNEPALVLTPPWHPTEKDDGLLTASEIATLTLDADWVVLSACNTAAGDKVGADALSGLARAFFFSGARAILVSHWSVYSQAAVQLTTRTFANLAEDRRMGRAEAFRRAMLTVIDEEQPPSYWAPFVVVGEGGAASGGRMLR